MKEQIGLPMEENMKKAVTEMLVLYMLAEEDRYIGEITSLISKRSKDILNIVFPYAAIYRMETSGFIEMNGKHNAPDGRYRQYYRITEAGRQRLAAQLEIYYRVTKGMDAIFGEEGAQACKRA